MTPRLRPPMRLRLRQMVLPLLAATFNTLPCAGQAQGQTATTQATPATAYGTGTKPSPALSSQCGAADKLVQERKFVEAEKAYRALIPVAQKELVAEHPLHCSLRVSTGLVLMAQGKAAEAETVFRATLALVEKTPKLHEAYALVCKNNLGDSLFTQRKYQEAEKVHREVYTQRMAQLGSENRDTLVSGYNLANCLLQLRRREEARAITSLITPIARRTLGPTHDYTILFEKLDKKL